ncbi:MAG: hypothetical protein QM757_05320 [Paludibaculum sp.]
MRRLWIRSLASGVSRPLVGTDGGYLPFWSPDESQIGFFQNGRLKVYRLGDGQMRDLAEAPLGRGGAWSPQGIILYAPRSSGFIYQIPEQGGQPAPATSLSPGTDENDHRWPEFLPDGRRFLYSVRARNKDHNCVRMGSCSIRARQPASSITTRRHGWHKRGWVTFWSLRGMVRLGHRRSM